MGALEKFEFLFGRGALGDELGFGASLEYFTLGEASGGRGEFGSEAGGFHAVGAKTFGEDVAAAVGE